MSRISGLRNDMNETFYKERKINNRFFDFLSKQNIIVPLILDIYMHKIQKALFTKNKNPIGVVEFADLRKYANAGN